MWYSSEARMYTLFAFITTINHLYFLRFIRNDAKKGKVGFLLSTIVGLYTHYFFVFILITQGSFLLLRFFKKSDSDPQSNIVSSENVKKPALLLLGKFITILITAGLFFLPWIVYFIRNGAASNTKPLIPPPTSFNIFQTFVNFLFGFRK